VLAALREIYDGLWERNVGTDGGKTLTWRGRIVVVAACTTAWDTAHSVIATMGDRFVLIRSDSEKGRLVAGRRAMQNVGHEPAMRAELADAVGGLIEHANYGQAIDLTEGEFERVLLAADITTRARTGVEFDYRGDVEFAHMPEAPTRFAKQLVQLIRGATVIGLDRTAAIGLALRCARDSMPPMRLAILEDIAANPGARPGDIRRRIDAPWKTVDRQCQALHMLHLVTCDEDLDPHNHNKTVWRYRLADGVSLKCLRPSPEMSVHEFSIFKERGVGTDTGPDTSAVCISTDKSGDAPCAADDWPAADESDGWEYVS
jgi:hypothetical protein